MVKSLRTTRLIAFLLQVVLDELVGLLAESTSVSKDIYRLQGEEVFLNQETMPNNVT